MPLQATSGAASYDAFGGGVPVEPVYIEQIFSTYLYTGNGSTQAITNGIDLSGKGGLTWIKERGAANYHRLFDTSRGPLYTLYSDLTNASTSIANSLTSFNSNGFSLGSGAGQNADTSTYTSWTFRKQPKFFDVVTYTGDGTSSKAVSHNLGSEPGCIIVKKTSSTGTARSWYVYHRSLGDTAYINLNLTSAAATGQYSYFYGGPSSTTFTVNAASGVNESGETFVAYIYAHNAGGFGLTGTDNVISCGSFTTSGTGQPNATINLGYEPQWIMYKRSDGTGDWRMQDNMRGLLGSWTGYSPFLRANTSDAESQNAVISITPTGFLADTGTDAQTYIYIAIRRGPMKVPTLGTTVYNAIVRTGTDAVATVSAGNLPDWVIIKKTAGGNNNSYSRLQGPNRQLFTELTYLEVDQGVGYGVTSFLNTSFTLGLNASGENQSGSSIVNFVFSRAPSFMDVVCYTGTGSNRTVTHNLGAVPELMIVKSRGTNDWAVYNSTSGATQAMYLNSTTAAFTLSTFWNDTAPTSTVFTVGTRSQTNESAINYVAYLFATCAGVSKVTSFTGNGSSQTINCGFTAGSRFVMIKRTDSTGDWYVWDSARGIVSGNDPHLSLNSTAAEVTTDDTIDTDSTGFIVNQVSATNSNVNGASYIVLAIA